MTYKTEPITAEWCEQYSKNFKPFKVKRSGLPINNCRLSNSRIYTVSEIFYSRFFREWAVRIGKIDYSIKQFRRVIEQPEQSEWITDPSKVNFHQNVWRKYELLMKNGDIQQGIVNPPFACDLAEASRLDDNGFWSFDLNSDGTIKWENKHDGQFKFRWISEPTNPITTDQIDLTKQADDKLAEMDEQTERTPLDVAIVQYVQANRNRMSDETIRHFAELIGTIKLGLL